MGRGGHNIKSVKHHEEMGNLRPVRHEGRIETISKPLQMLPEPPADFDKRHREKWQEVCKRVFDLSILTDSDLDMIALYVKTWWINIDAWKEITRNGITIETSRGITKNPAINVMNETSKTLMALAGLFGFSPQARMRIRTEERKPEDPMAKFLLDN